MLRTQNGLKLGMVNWWRIWLLLFDGINAFCSYIGSKIVEHGDATFGEVFKVFFAFTISAFGVSNSTAVAPNANKPKDSAASIFEILESKPKIDWSNEDGITLSTVPGDIVFEHVSFGY